MIKQSAGFTGVAASLKRKHFHFFAKIDQFYDALNNLRYEGKVSLGKNTKVIGETIKYFKAQVLPHIRLEEDVVFDFLNVHMPKLDPTLRFLREDHKEFKMNLSAFELLFKRFKAEKNDLKRIKIQERLRAKGIYIVSHMRSHIRLEDESIYKVIDQELHPDEKRLFLEKMKEKGKRISK